MALSREIVVGARFGRLTIVSTEPPRRGRSATCRCDCGNEITVRVYNIGGRTRSCGCIRVEAATALKLRHGMAATSIYSTWRSMIRRCSSPKDKHWPDYGGRGITVCERWRTFENFYADMGDRPDGLSIDRVNNDGNYEPGNCRWATDAEQRANRRPQRASDSCIAGHAYTEANTRFNKRGDRACRACDAARAREYRRNRSAVAA